jgi:uncharacterized membrane protein YfcA
MEPFIIAYAVACIFLAAVVRGYSGFGFSLLSVTSLSLALPPAEILPSIFMLEIVASVHLLPSIWKDIHWRSIGLLLAGCLVGTPFGVWLLANVPTPAMLVALGAAVLVSTVLLWRGYALKTMPGKAATAATGAVSGLLNGAMSIAGPPVIVFYFASPAGMVAGRASLIAYFLGTDIIALPLLAREGLVTWEAFVRALIFLPALLAGVWLGARSFQGADPKVFRKWVLAILAVLAVLTAGKGIAGLGWL